MESANGARLGSAEFTGGDLNSEYSLRVSAIKGARPYPAKLWKGVLPQDLKRSWITRSAARLNVSLLSGDTEKSVKKFAQQAGDVEFLGPL